MKTTKKLTLLQQIGALFILAGGVFTIARIFSFVNVPSESLETWGNLISLVGFIAYLVPLFRRKLFPNAGKIVLILAVVTVLGSL